MKRLILILSSSLLLFASSCQDKDAPKYVPGSGQSGQEKEEEVVPVDPDYSKLTSSNHPRMIMTDVELASLKARLAAGTDEMLTTLHRKAILIADNFVGGKEIKYELDASGKRILTQAKDCTSRLMHLSYAYRCTGEKKYLDEVERVLGWVLNFPDWNAKRHFLDPAEMAGGVAICYDWLYSSLKADTRKKIEKCFTDYLFYPANNKIWNLNFYTSTDNWNTSCNGGIITAALAIYETNPADCRKMIEKSLESIPICMNATFNPDGAYEEGYSYLTDVLTKIPALIITPLQDCVGTDCGVSATKGWKEASRCLLFLEGIVDSPFAFSDAGRDLRPCYGQWYYAYAYKDPSVLFNELKMVKANKYTPSGDYGRFYPMVLAYCAKMGNVDFSKIAAPTVTMFSGHGDDAGHGVDLCIFRTKWDKSNADKYFGVKGGKATQSHAHMDGGEFVYDAFGVRWSMDLGLQSYTTLETVLKNKGGSLWDMAQNSLRWTVLRLNSHFHSTITINDMDHKVNGYVKMLSSYEYEDGTKGCQFDLTPLYGDAVRGCLRTVELKGDILYIIDEITAPKTAQAKVSWRMVTPTTPTVTKDYIQLKSAGKTMYLKTTSNGTAAEYATWEAKGNQYDAENSGISIVGYNATVTTGKTITYTTTLSPTL